MHDPVWLVTLIAIAVVCCLWFGSEPVRYLAGAVIIVGARPMWVTVRAGLSHIEFRNALRYLADRLDGGR